MRIRYPRGCVLTGFAIFVMVSLAMIHHAAAVEEALNLPITPVTIEVSDGVDYRFIVELSGVPTGYDVDDGSYPGWCVDLRSPMARSPATHTVILYSSGDPSGELVDERWDMVNYILNHKQGSADDIQQALWYFVHMDNEDYTPTSAVAWTLIDDAEANGAGFVPGFGEIIAVICYPVVVFPGQEDVQISIIEVTSTVIPEFPSWIVLPLFIGATLVVVAAYRRLHRRAERPPSLGIP